MIQNQKKKSLLILVAILAVVNAFLLNLDFQNSNRGLTFAMLDVDQGDALFIESPSGMQILVDGGPPGKILGQLSRVMSPFDHSIDSIIITNPDLDHIGGFADVLERYKVDQVFESGTFNDSKAYQNLKQAIKDKNIQNILARRGMKIDMGGGAFIDILFPNQDVSTWDSNDGSIVMKLSYGKTSIMLTGDATMKTEKIILKENLEAALQSDILKVGHHGSRTSSLEAFVKAVAPSFALISAGKDNQYGHPHPEILDILVSSEAKIYRTDLLGTIIMKSDGEKESFSFRK